MHVCARVCSPLARLQTVDFRMGFVSATQWISVAYIHYCYNYGPDAPCVHLLPLAVPRLCLHAVTVHAPTVRCCLCCFCCRCGGRAGQGAGAAAGAAKSPRPSLVPAKAAHIVDAAMMLLEGSCVTPRILACAALIHVVDRAECERRVRQATACPCAWGKAVGWGKMLLLLFPLHRADPPSLHPPLQCADAAMYKACESVSRGMSGVGDQELDVVLEWLRQLAPLLPPFRPSATQLKHTDPEPEVQYSTDYLAFAKRVLDKQQVCSGGGEG